MSFILDVKPHKFTIRRNSVTGKAYDPPIVGVEVPYRDHGIIQLVDSRMCLECKLNSELIHIAENVGRSLQAVVKMHNLLPNKALPKVWR